MISLLDTPGTSPVDWYVVFEQGASHWWKRLLRQGFGHVYALRWDGFNWLQVSQDIGHLDVDVLPITEPVDPQLLVPPGATILHVTALRRPRYRIPWIFAPWTCVETTKGLLGIRAWWVLTPYQLYRYLRKTHGLEQT